MNNKSKLSQLLALVFAFALLATACGSSSDAATPQPQETMHAQADDSSDAADDAT